MWLCKKITKKFMMALLLTGFISVPLCNVPSQGQTLVVQVNDKLLQTDAPPILYNGRLMLPMRAIFEAMDATVTYFPDSQTIQAGKGKTFIKLGIDSRIATVDGEIIALDVPPFIRDQRVYVPARFAAETLGATVDYHKETGVVFISTCSAGRTSIDKIDQIAKIKANDYGRAELSPVPQLYIYNNSCDWDAAGETYTLTLAQGNTWNINPVKDVKILTQPSPALVSVGKADNASMTVSFPQPNIMRLETQKYSPWVDDYLMIPMNVVLKNPVGDIKVTITREGHPASETFTIAEALRPPDGILISKQKAQIELLEYLNLNAHVFPHDAYDTGIVWSSSDVRIADVDQTGLVRGLALGNVVIYAKTKQGSYTDFCMLEVIPEYYSVIYDYADHLEKIKVLDVPVPKQNARHAGITADIRLLSPGKWNIDRYKEELLYSAANTEKPYIINSDDTHMDIEFPDEQTLRITLRSDKGWSNGADLMIPLNVRLENPSGEIIVSVTAVNGEFQNQTYRFPQ